MNSWQRPDETVAAVVLILFRQQHTGINNQRRTPRRMAIGCSDLFRVIVLHGVFVPGTAAVQRRNGCGPDTTMHPKQQERTWATPRVYDITLSDSGSPVHFFLTWTRHIPGVTVLRIASGPLIPVHDLYKTTTLVRNANEMTIMQLDLSGSYFWKYRYLVVLRL